MILAPRGPFSLAQSIAFLGGFTPIHAGGDERCLRLALCDDGGEPLAFSARQAADGSVEVAHRSALPAGAVEAHVARVLSLDVDGTDWSAVGERDPVVGALQERFPGRRPVCFGTPWEAAAWAVLSQRTSMAQASRVKAALTTELGEALELEGVALRAFPAPGRLARLDAFTGLWPMKAERLRALAHAAQAGELDPAELRRLDPADALAHLQALPGLGPFSAALVLVRGAGAPDVAPTHERRIVAALAERYGEDASLEEVGERWRPYRSWASFLLRNAAEQPG